MDVVGLTTVCRVFRPRVSFPAAFVRETTPEVEFAIRARFGATGSQVPAGVCSAATLNFEEHGNLELRTENSELRF